MTDEEVGLILNSQLGKEATAFLAKLGGSVASEVGAWVTPEMRSKMAWRQINLALKTKQKLREAGLPQNAVKWKLLVPLLNAAVLEDETEEGGEQMQDRWASLLANASAYPDSVSPAFPGMLGEITAREARFFDELVKIAARYRHHEGFRQDELGEVYSHLGLTRRPWSRFISQADADNATQAFLDFTNDRREFSNCLNNLLRLRLIEERNSFEIDWDHIRTAASSEFVAQAISILPSSKQAIEIRHCLSGFGLEFHRACQPPKKTP